MDVYCAARDVGLKTSQQLLQYGRASAQNIKSVWKTHKPTTLLGWMAFVGMSLVTVATVSSVLVALSGVLIALCWIGVVAYTFLVTMSTVTAVVLGGATLFIAGTCAMVGFGILSTAVALYFAQAMYQRIKARASSYYTWPSAPSIKPATASVAPFKKTVPAASAVPTSTAPATAGPQQQQQQQQQVAAPAAADADADSVGDAFATVTAAVLPSGKVAAKGAVDSMSVAAGPADAVMLPNATGSDDGLGAANQCPAGSAKCGFDADQGLKGGIVAPSVVSTVDAAPALIAV